ncbi:cysteine-rich receptor-like protein kinase 44 [Aegilops tauschii subsp. strangulata]|uniref:cysteine-rich receptor-like protein kinase 44 n=1 Tax=Aegilops tauschii subsp. strangulata TaxID=200361 RepID=UPI00098B6B32|nr:putative receptor-like protein kinase At4g00960 [Triticum aestivum]XP_044329955.1 putative receptor-like protein kinase At4g00960 [Triticum aestivum]
MDFELHLIKSITNNFSKNQEVGSGAYGAVYRAVHNGEEIAVKRLHALQGLDDKEFDNEFRNFTKIFHKNVVRLIGYCYESQEKFVEHNGDLIRAKAMERVLCFEYMQRGSLEKYIGDKPCELDWTTCYEIIKGTCEGLNHLHMQKKHIFHLDMKPANILLDNSMAPKIADLGLSKLVSSTITYKAEVKKGTYGYMPPEYINNGFISEKFDVFSLGVIIIKMMAGNTGHVSCFEMSPKEFIELVSKTWKEKMQAVSGYSSHEIYILQVRRCIEIALRCICKDRKERPNIEKIVHELEELEVETNKIALPFDRSKDLILKRSCATNDVAVDPAFELRFLFEPRKEVSCCLQLTNKTDGFLAFNIKVNKNKYRAQPSIGTMPPCSKCYVIVTLRPQGAAPPNMQCHDMLLVQSISISEQLASEDTQISYQEVFKTTLAEKVVDEVKLPIVYVPLLDG